MQLLNTSDGCVADVVGLAVLEQRSVDLARAQNDTLNLLGLVNSSAVSIIRDNPLEVGVVGKFLKVRAGNRVTQQGLGEENNKGCSEELVI